MRRIRYLLLCIVFAVSVKAQNYHYRYWFDNDHEAAQTGISQGSALHLDMDVSKLSESLHALHFQVIENDTLPSTIQTQYFVKTMMHSATERLRCISIIDGEKYNEQEVDVTGGVLKYSLDVNAIPAGLHHLAIMLVSPNSGVSEIQSAYFLRSSTKEGLENVTCFYTVDGEEAMSQAGGFVNGMCHLNLDVSSMEEGLHSIYCSIVDGDGYVSSVESSYFIRTYLDESSQFTCYYSFDGEETFTKGGKFTDGICHLDLDASSLDDGLHSLSYYIAGEGGAVSAIKTAYFLRTSVDETTKLRCFYNIDNEQEYNEAGSFGKGEYTFDFDATPLAEGLHTLNYYFATEKGTVTDIKTAFFVREIARGEGIIRYEYAVNGGEYANTVTLDAPVDTLRLTELQLPEELANRDVSTFHLRAYDANGGMVEDSVRYIKMPMPELAYDNKNVLKITPKVEGATVFYRIEGLSEEWMPYSAPLTLSDNRAVNAFARAEGYNDSEEAVFTPENFTAESVKFAFVEPMLTISCETEGATIHYIINEEEAEYTAPVEITEPCTVYAYATKPYFNNSDTLSYNIIRCADPVISYTGGNVTISCETEGARIYYTIDESVPDSTSLRYTEPFTASNNMAVKAVAYLDGALHSAVSDYIVDIFRVAAPTFAYNEPLLTISCETEGATIHYIINEEEAEYTEPIEITEPCTVYAYATKPYFNSSDTVSYTVEIKNMEFSSNGLSYNILSFDDYTCEVAKSRDAEYQGNINIPQTAERYGKSWNVVAIADEAFKDCHKVTSIIIPNSITAVGKSSLETGNRNMLLYCTSQTLPLMPKDFGNIIIDGVANFIQLADSPSDGTSPTHDFSCPEPFTARKISYEHSYTQHTGIGFSEGWETIALPFDVQMVYHVTAQETIAPFKAGGTQRKFWLYELTDAGFVEAEAIKAYKPYIISMPNNEEYVSSYNLPGKVSFRAVNALVAPSASSTVSHGNKMLVATTHGVDAADNVYAINSYQATDNYREGSCFIANLRNVRPFEAYITSEQSLGAKAFSLKELASEMTGIEDVTTPSVDIPACYNLSGQKVGAEYKGIVIRNGKKTLIK